MPPEAAFVTLTGLSVPTGFGGTVHLRTVKD